MKKSKRKYDLKRKKPLNKIIKENRRKLVEKIENRYYILMIIIIILISYLTIYIFNIQVINNDKYSKKIETLSEKTVYGKTSPRGRIYDKNKNLIVDNKPVKVIYYKKRPKITIKEEIKIAENLEKVLKLDYEKITKKNLKIYYNILYKEKVNKKITEKEWTLLEERKLTNNDIYDLKLERITDKELETLSNKDKKVAYIYYLMNKGYSYEEKIIKNSDVTDEEYANISENINELKGVGTRLDWDRQYLYGDTFKSILGTVSDNGIPKELSANYLAKGYSLDDKVGTSYLEYTYENYLKGKKNKYKVLSDGTYKLLEEGTRGNDLILTIDINLQKEIEKILEKNILNAKKEPNTQYYNRSFVIITDSKTGNILAMSGKQAIKQGNSYKIVDYTPGILTSPVVIGSAIKGASQIVAYNNNALSIGEIRYDNCIKLKDTNEKCSWKPLGRLNDVSALALSSNTYQFLSAIKVGGATYKYNAPLKINKNAFNIYRNTFSEFGLGVKTGIDLPKESLGFKGTNKESGLLLDFSIGQYDTYTPIQLSQYITTIANSGNRLEPNLLSKVYSSKENLKEIIYEAKPKILNKVNTKDIYMNKVKEGFRSVMTFGTGIGYINEKYKPAGKTGTSQSFIDTNGDNKIDTETISNTFVGYAPYDNPEVTFTVISPDVSHRLSESNYSSYVNKKITYEISQKYFEIYK